MDKESSYDSQETGRRQHIPLVALMAMGYLLAGTRNSPGAGEGAVSAGRKESWWELTRWGVRGLGVGHHRAAAQECWHKSQVEHARISHECAPTLLLLGLCPTHPVIQLPWRLLAPRTSHLSHCKPSVRAHKGS